MGKIQVDDKGKVKFRFIEFELEGLNSTIEESIKNIVHSMNRGGPTAQRQLPSRAGSTSQSVMPHNGASEGADVPLELDSQLDLELEESSQESKTAGGSSSKLRRYTQPTFLNDLDLDSGATPFKTYAEKQNPKSDNRRYLVIAGWLKKQRNLDVISPDHVYTCNQKMGWRTQKDVGQPFRYMKRKSYFDAPGRNQWKLTHIGLDQLDKPEEE